MRSQKLYEKAQKIIPGATQLFSKRSELHLPKLWPAYYQKAKGCFVWDLDGKKYADMSFMGIGSCILGYADADVDRAVHKAINKGSMSTLNCPEEVECAQLLCRIHPWAEKVRFARGGGEAVSIAVRIARAHTGKEKILFCGYHGWHDWYVAANIANKKTLDNHLLAGIDSNGVPRSLKGTALPFTYNDTEGFLKLFKHHKQEIAAVVMEPLRHYNPEPGFLETIRQATERDGIVLIFDEVSSGWRMNAGGVHLLFKVYPDLAVFAKAMSNGYPMAAIIGRENVMRAAEKTFISSTYWTERIGPVAALATIKKLIDKNVPEHLIFAGKKVQEGWQWLAKKHKLSISVNGPYPLSHFSFEYSQPLVLKTLFTQEMLRRRFLASTSFYASFAHTKPLVESYLTAVDKTFALIAKAIKSGSPKRFLKTSVCQSGFKRLN